MVLLIDHRRVAWSAIHRALRMSDALDTELAIVLAIPPEPDGTYPARVIRHLVDLVHLRRPRRGFALELAHGGVRSEGRAIARRIAPQLVVVDPELAPDACRLADDLAAPVIVAR